MSYQVTLCGRRIRGKVVSAASIKIVHDRPGHLRHKVEDKFAHLAWSANLGLADTSTVAVLLYILTDRKDFGRPR